MRPERWILRLYPSAWRTRYGEEMEAFLDDAGIDLTGLFNLFKGAVYMQMRTNSFAKLALLWSLGGLAAGYAGSYLLTPTYVSRAVLQVTGPADDPVDYVLQLRNEVLSRKSLGELVLGPKWRLYDVELLQTFMAHIGIQVEASRPGKPTAFVVSFTDSNADEARRAVQELVRLFVAANLRHESNSPNPLVVLDPPSKPAAPSSPNRAALAAFGFAGGFGIAIVIFVARKWKIIPQAGPLVTE